MELTFEQKKIVDARDCNLLVSAAAGSGKTAVLVERIMELIREGTDVDQLLVVTFTNAAAASMREKIAARLEKEAAEDMFNEHIIKQLSLINKAEITTIDSFCLGLVKDNFNQAGVDSNLNIGDEAEMELLKADVMNAMLEQEYIAADSAFTDLVECFAIKESDENLVDIISNINRTANSFPEPFSWIRNAIEALSIEDEDEIMDLPWVKETIKDIYSKIECCYNMASFCVDLTDNNEGFAGYEKSLCQDLDFFKSLLSKPDIIKSIETNHKFPMIGRLSGKDYDKDIQDTIKTQRDLYKKAYNSCFDMVAAMDHMKDEYIIMGRMLVKLLQLAERFNTMLMTEKKNRNIYEFYDIEHMALRLVCQGYDALGKAIPSDIGRGISDTYKEIMIDEYQDSNFLQEAILNCVSGEIKGIHNMFMVGDVKQSIYKFRLARPDLFIQKYNTYSEEDSDYKKLVLTKNFRSRRTVLSTVNALFSRLMRKDLGNIDYTEDAYLNFCDIAENFPGEDVPCELLITDEKPLKEDLDSDSDELVEDINKDELEAEMIMERIEQLNSSKAGYSYKDIVILLRSTKKLGPVIQNVADKKDIPVYIENEGGFFDAAEVQILLAMLSCIDNSYQDYELAAALKSPLAGITSQELAVIAGTYNKDKPDLSHKSMFYDKVLYYVNHNSGSELEVKLKKFLSRLDYLKQNKQYMSISDMLRYILSETGYYWYAGAMPMGSKRQANIDALIARADAYEESSYKGLFNFLRYINRMKVNSLDFSEPVVLDENENVVRVMTMHKSKGLEFPIVFVSGLGKKFNDMDTKGNILVHSDYYLMSDAYDAKNRLKRGTFAKKAVAGCIRRETLGEELRVLYVALTRAKDMLIMTAKTSDFDKLAKSAAACLLDNEGYLNYIVRTGANTYIEWIMSALLAETGIKEREAFKEYLKKRYNICLKLADARQLISNLKLQHKEEEQENIKKEPEEQDYNTITARLGWLSNQEKKSNFRSKMSITDIKKMKNSGEENPGYEPYMEAFKVKDENSDRPILKILQPEQIIKGNQMGTVIHKIMECIDFSDIDRDQVQADIDNMFELGIIEEMYREKISVDKIYRMLASPLGRRMYRAECENHLYREKQFYIAMDAADIYDENFDMYDDRTVVVQGIIDAYFIEDGEIVLLDYKTDNVGKPYDLVLRYHVQLDKYAETLEQITGLKVKEKLIYSFYFNETINCSID